MYEVIEKCGLGISGHHASSINVYSEISNSGLGICIPFFKAQSHINLSTKEQEISSAWRELMAILYGLNSFKHLLSGKVVNWFTDNYAASIIVKKGCSKAHLQKLALIFLTFALRILFASNQNGPRESKIKKPPIFLYS